MNKEKYRKRQNEYDKENFRKYTVALKLDIYDEMQSCIDMLKTNRNRFTAEAIEEKIAKEKGIQKV